ncbi:hypothetical protein HDU86_007875 [Geranomyces michiganensis]|nr:hypothetical protein HDU86_007875 [Geranomyces michiganensis]
MPVINVQASGLPQTLRESRSEGRAASKNANTRLEVRAEDLVDKILRRSCAPSDRQRHCAEAQRPVFVQAICGGGASNPIRPDIVVRDARTGRAVAVVDAKNYVGAAPLPLCQIEKLVRDMQAVGAPIGMLFVAKQTKIGPRTMEYATMNNVRIVRDGKHALRDMEDAIQIYRLEKGENKKFVIVLKKLLSPNIAFNEQPSGIASKIKSVLRLALDKLSLQANSSCAAAPPAKKTVQPLPPRPPPSAKVKSYQLCSNDYSISVKLKRGGSNQTGAAPALGPLKKDGTPDMRFKANREALALSSSA